MTFMPVYNPPTSRRGDGGDVARRKVVSGVTDGGPVSGRSVRESVARQAERGRRRERKRTLDEIKKAEKDELARFGPGYKKVHPRPVIVRNDGQIALPASPISGRMLATVEPDGQVVLGDPLSRAEVGALLAGCGRQVDGAVMVLFTAMYSEIARLSAEVERLRARTE